MPVQIYRAVMKILNADCRLKGYRFPREIIGYAVWAYVRFSLRVRPREV